MDDQTRERPIHKGIQAAVAKGMQDCPVPMEPGDRVALRDAITRAVTDWYRWDQEECRG